MSPQLVGVLAAIFAEQARVVAMSAENLVAINKDQPLPFSHDDFCAAADRLDGLSIEARNCYQ